MDNEREVYQRRLQEMGEAFGQPIYGGINCEGPSPFDRMVMGKAPAASPRAGHDVGLRKATVLQIGCQEILLIESGSRVVMKSQLGCTSLSKQDLAVIVAELTRLQAVLVEDKEER